MNHLEYTTKMNDYDLAIELIQDKKKELTRQYNEERKRK